MDNYHDLELTVSDTEICTSNHWIGLGGLLVTLEEGVSFELGKYNPARSEVVEKEWHKAKRTFGKPENFTQYVRVFGPQFDPETVDSIIEEAGLDSRYIFMCPCDPSGKQGIEIAMSADYTINFDM